MDSNHDYGRQRPVCCHYTIGQRLCACAPTPGQGRMRQRTHPLLARVHQPKDRRPAAAQGHPRATRRPQRLDRPGDPGERPQAGLLQIVADRVCHRPEPSLSEKEAQIIPHTAPACQALQVSYFVIIPFVFGCFAGFVDLFQICCKTNPCNASVIIVSYCIGPTDICKLIRTLVFVIKKYNVIPD